jgi:hypothetical protein
MGVLTLAELKTEVRAALGGRHDLDSRLTSIVNLAQMRLARIHDFDEMEILSTTTVNNTANDNDRFLVLPDKREVYSIVLLDGANSRKLVQRTPQFWDRYISKPEYWSRFIPSDYMIWNNTIEAYPLPDKTYTIRIRWTKWPTALSADTDVSEFLNKDDVLIELAVSYALRSLGKEDDADKHERAAMRMLGEAANMDDSKPDMQITPALSDSQVISGNPLEYWRDPFRKE